jgi:hypothetical protein
VNLRRLLGNNRNGVAQRSRRIRLIVELAKLFSAGGAYHYRPDGPRVRLPLCQAMSVFTQRWASSCHSSCARRMPICLETRATFRRPTVFRPSLGRSVWPRRSFAQRPTRHRAVVASKSRRIARSIPRSTIPSLVSHARLADRVSSSAVLPSLRDPHPSHKPPDSRCEISGPTQRRNSCCIGQAHQIVWVI